MRYVIIAPTYNQKTAGIAVLQELQKWLIKSGKDAIIPNININAPYAIQDDDIVVYPEIIPGNPLNAKRVVRYILNVPGKLGGTTEYDSREILVAYTKDFSRHSNGIYLEIPIIEDFFTNRGLERTVDCFWVGKGRNTHHPATKGCIEITYQWPRKRRELAELLNRTRVFYSYDDCTHLLTEAMLCGCAIKLIKNDELVDHIQIPPPDPEEFQRQLDQFIQLTWYPEMESGRKAAEYIASVIARRPPTLAPLSSIPDLTSIIILTWNQLEYTKACLASIRAHTDVPYEIIFVDNGSTDGTLKWLRKLVKENAGYKLIENGKNLGFAKGCNQGIQAATGAFILLLNNDVVVTEAWISGMLECLRRDPGTGIVGPMTNNISGRQKVDKVGYSSIEGLDRYACTFREKNRHRRLEARRVVGFCMLFRRSLVDQIGLLDESFGTGNFEDDDFCARAALAGYQNRIAGDVFIHHFGSRSFIGNRVDYGSALTGNRKIYADKWRAIEQEAEPGRKIRALVAQEQGGERFQRGDLQGAVELYLTAIRLMPGERSIYYELAETLIASRSFQEALDILKESPVDGTDKIHIVLTGYGKEGMNRDDEALDCADRAMALDERFARALNLKGILAYKRQDRQAAQKWFCRAVECDPSYGEPFTNLGILKWAAGEKEDALSLLEKGFILSPTVPDIATMFHAAAVETGEWERAEEAFREAKGLHANCRHLCFLLIDLLISREKHATAISEIESAMAAFDVDDGFIDAALEVRGKLGPLEIRKKGGGETLSLCMIVKNEQPNLVRSLSSVKAAVDEIIVVDTGSTDRTKDIATVFGAKVFDAPWNDDFAEARNIALSKATGDWIFVLDADEAVSPADCSNLRNLLEHAACRKDTAGWLVTTRNYSPDMNLEGWTANDGTYGSEVTASGWFPSVKVRLFRNDPHIRYEGAVHEMVEPSMKRAGLTWLPCDLIVHHYGYITGGGSGPSKGASYYQLGKKKIEQTSGDHRSVYELAVQASRLKKYDEAVALWHRYLSSDCREDRPLAFLNLGHALIETGRYAEAREASMAALSIDPGLKEAGLNTALCDFYTGRYREAVSRLEGLIAATSDYPPAKVLLSAARLLSGEKGTAEEMVQTLRRQNINGAPFYQVYGQKLQEAGRNGDAETILEAARKSWTAMLASLGIPTTEENIGALMAAVPLDGAGKRETHPEKAKESTRSGSGRPCLSLCMIVKNEERTIARALESAKALADEMIVVDTGSTDGTKEIAAALGAKVFDFSWTDDFSSARNHSLSRATGDWILVIDADETLSSRDHATIRDLIKKSPDGTGGYDLTTRNYVVEANTSGWVANDGSYRDEEAGTGWYPSRKVRLFRNDPRIRFAGAVHELVEQSMLGAGITIAACDVPVHHTGKLDRKSVLEKGERYYLLGLKKLEESGGTPRAILELATQAGELGRYDDAIRLWKRFLDGKPVQDVKRATVNLIDACLNADRFDDALREARKVAGQANGTRELLLNCAAAEFFAGDLRKATRMAEKILNKEPDYPPALILLASAHALAGHAGKSTECLQRIHVKGLQLRSQILPVIEKLRKAGKKDEADRLLNLLDWQPQTASGPTPPSPDRSRQESGCSVQR